MTKLLYAIVSLINMLFKSHQKREKQHEQREHQEKVDEAREDPATAFDEHFNGKKKNEGDQ